MEGINLSSLMQYLISGIALGTIYGLIAIGYNVSFKGTGIINFSQGDFVVLGGLTTAYLHNKLGVPLFLAIILALSLCGTLGTLIARFIIQPRRHLPPFDLTMMTFALAIIMQAMALIIFSYDPLYYPSFFPGSIKLLGGYMSYHAIFILILSILLIVLLRVFFKKNRLGRGMIANSINTLAATSVGIDVNKVSLMSFAMGTFLGGLGGVLVTPINSITFSAGLSYALKGMTASVIGGMGNITGALVGGLLLGLVEALACGFISSGYKDAISLILLILFLIFRPQGIFGVHKDRKA
jgi:branched-chain amino acid transport system permease protein